MPNWVFNTLKVSGNRSQVGEFAVKAASNNSEFSFMGFVKPEDAELYKDNWYNWNIENWGCKWDASDVQVQVFDQGANMFYEFSTPWGAPINFFEKLVALHPELSFELRYAEEQGWGGEEHGEGGVHWVVDEWDVPQSHADRMDHIGWCYCEEMRDDELEDTYDDCPRKMEVANV